MVIKRNISIYKVFIYLFVGILLFQGSFSPKVSFFKYTDEILVILSFILMLATLLKNKKIPKCLSVNIFLIFLFVFLGIISCVINSRYNVKNLVSAAFTACKFLMLTSSFMIISIDKKTRIYFLSALKFWGLAVFAVGIINLLFPSVYTKLFFFGHVFRSNVKSIVAISSLFFHPGLFGWFMLLQAIIYYSEFLVVRDSKQKKKVVLFLIASLFSFKSKVFIAIIIITFYEMIFRYKIDLKKLFLGLFISLIVIIVFRDNLLFTYNTYLEETDVVSARQSLTDNSFRIMKEYFPLGVGFGKYASADARVHYSEYYYKYGLYRVYGLDPRNPIFGTDTFWPAIIGETGFFGLVVFCIFIFNLYSLLMRKICKTKDNFLLVYCNIALLAFIQTICESFGAPSFNSSPQNVVLAILIGLSLNNYIKDVDVDEENSIYYS